MHTLTQSFGPRERGIVGKGKKTPIEGSRDQRFNIFLVEGKVE